MTPEDWYELLNGFVFFWFDRSNAEMIRAKYPESVLLAFDFRGLLFANEDSAYLTPINTGSTAYGDTRRCRETFVPFKTWAESRWSSEEIARGVPRKRVPKPVELAISKGIDNISRFRISEY
jgi:hypothetical protein